MPTVIKVYASCSNADPWRFDCPCRHGVQVVVSKYNEDNKLRTLMSVELWLDQLQSQRSDKKAALIEVLAKLDLLV